jgi:selenocysteine lyase/cysteine desulfurase
MTFDALRAELDQLDGLSYLDHALRGPVPRCAREAVAEALREAGRGSLARPAQAEAVERTRGLLAGLLGWSPAEIAFCLNTTHAIASFAQAVPWREGDRVLVHEDEVPSNVLPWRACPGVEVEVLPSRDGRLELSDLEEALGRGRVRVVSLAAVALPTGERRDLAAIAGLAEARGAWLCVDGAQAVGALRLDLSRATAVFGSGRKWLLGPPEVGFLAVRSPALPLLNPAAGGALALAPDGRWHEDARRFEGGALAAPTLAGLGRSLELLARIGLEAIEAGVLARAADVRALAEEAGLPVLSPTGPAASGVVHVGLRNAPGDLEGQLAAEGVVARQTSGGLRVSAHAWNTRADVERLFLALGAL